MHNFLKLRDAQRGLVLRSFFMCHTLCKREAEFLACVKIKHLLCQSRRARICGDRTQFCVTSIAPATSGCRPMRGRGRTYCCIQLAYCRSCSTVTASAMAKFGIKSSNFTVLRANVICGAKYLEKFRFLALEKNFLFISYHFIENHNIVYSKRCSAVI